MINEYKDKCCICECVEDTIYFDCDNNIYCEECWIQHEAKIKSIL